MVYIQLACWNENPNCRPTTSQVVKDLKDVYVFDIEPNESKIINMNQPKQDDDENLPDIYVDDFTIDKIEELLTPKNKFIIKNITNIKEKELKDLTKEFVDQLYFNQNLGKPFGIF